MKKVLTVILLFTLIVSKSTAAVKDEIIKNLENINNLSFKFEQNVNGKIENGNCVIEYPKKIFCSYNLENEKILVSNGRSLVIQTSNSYYIYPIDKTPLSSILDKKFLLEKIINSNERIIDEKFVNFNFSQDENKINVFFDKKTFNLIGWQTLDIYQNLSITYLNSIRKNKKLNKDQFKLPLQN